MSDFVSVGWPLALVGLLALPILFLGTVRSRYPLSTRRRIISTVTRASAVALLVLAMADLRIGWPTDDLAVAVIADGSASVSQAERDNLALTMAPLRQSDTDTVWLDVAEVDDDPMRTDLAPRLELALAGLPRDRVRRVLLATDGRDPGDVYEALRSARRQGVDVSVLPFGESPPIDGVAVGGIEVPRLIRAGETLDVGIAVHAAVPARTHLEVLIDGEQQAESDVDVVPGHSNHRLGVTFPEDEGVHELVVVARAEGDALTENDRWRTLVRVLTRPRVLFLHPADAVGAPPLATVLRDADFNVDARPIQQAPDALSQLDPYGVVYVDEAKLDDLNETQQMAIRGFVQELGGGLVTITGTNAVRRSPEILREIEPIRPPPAIPEPRPLELVLVIDRSSSMDGRPIAQARAAGMAAVRALREDALCGTVAFSGGADRVMAPVPHDQFDDVQAYISRYTAGGGTNIAAALSAAGSIMSNDDRYIHHIILLSDGESDPASALAQASAIASRGVSISAITLGPYSQLMSQIARIGRGRYHVASNPGSLPALFVREAQFRQPPAHRQVSFRPTVETPHRMVDGIDFGSGPPLLGHALSAAKPGADTMLLASDQGPLLAHWHSGMGQVATYTSATTGGWANEWRGWSGFRTFWSQVTWGVMRARTVEPLELRVEETPGRADLRTVTVVGPTVNDQPVPEVILHRAGGAVADPAEETPEAEGTTLDLREVGPGLWQARAALGDGFLVDARMPADPEPTAAVAVDHPYPPELAAFGPDRETLAGWAALGGGGILSAPNEIRDGVQAEPVPRSLRLPMLVAALILYLFGILLLRLPDSKAAANVPAPRSRRSLAPAPTPASPGPTGPGPAQPGPQGTPPADPTQKEAA